MQIKKVAKDKIHKYLLHDIKDKENHKPKLISI